MPPKTKNGKILDRQFYSSGVTVISQGDEGRRAFIVESGKLEVFITDIKGEEIAVAELGPGAIIGEIALVSGGIRTASVRTIKPTVLVSISAHDFKEALKKPGTLKDTLGKAMSKRVQESLSALEKRISLDHIKDENLKEEAEALLNKLRATHSTISESFLN